MKKVLFGLALFLAAGLAFGQNIQQVDLNVSQRLRAYTTGLLVGPQSVTLLSNTSINSNRVTRMLGTSASVVGTATSTLTCTDSAAVTLTGARLGDPCFLGLPATHPTNGSGSFSCVVSANDAVKVRYCNPSAGSLTPSTATFYFRVISSQ